MTSVDHLTLDSRTVAYLARQGAVEWAESGGPGERNPQQGLCVMERLLRSYFSSTRNTDFLMVR